MSNNKEQNPTDVALAFVAAINSRDPDRLAALMTEDHVFTDMDGQAWQGRETMRQGWVGYYRLFPDYAIEIGQVERRGDLVVLPGRSTGTLSDYGQEALRREDGSLPPADELQGPAIWTARVRGDRMAEWRVYADTPAARADLGLSGGEGT